MTAYGAKCTEVTESAQEVLSSSWRSPNSLLIPRESVVEETLASHRDIPRLLIPSLGCVNSSCGNSCRSF